MHTSQNFRFSLVMIGVIALHGFVLMRAFDTSAPLLRNASLPSVISVSMLSGSQVHRPAPHRNIKFQSESKVDPSPEVKTSPVKPQEQVRIDNKKQEIPHTHPVRAAKSKSKPDPKSNLISNPITDSPPKSPSNSTQHASQEHVTPIEHESNRSMNDSVHLVVPSFKGHRPVPTYPSQALSMRHQGNVIVRVLIGVQGEVIDAQIHQSSGSEWLDHAAKKASLRAKFHPYVRNGIALNSTVDLPFNFVIKR